MLKIDKYCEKCDTKIYLTSHFCFSCLRELCVKRNKTEDEKKKFDKEFNKISLVYVDDLAREYLEILEQAPIFWSEMCMKREKATKVINRIREMKIGFFIRFFEFKPRHTHNHTERIIWFSGQELKAISLIKNKYPYTSLPPYLRKYLREYEKERLIQKRKRENEKS